MHFVDHDGARVAYRIDGQGPALVLVHGTGSDGATNWDPILPLLAPHRTVIRPDYAGSGHTRDAAPSTLERLAGQVAAAARAAGATAYDLVGFSLGAAVAARVAAREPACVRSLVTLGGFVSARDARSALQFNLWQSLIRTDRRALARVFMLTGFSPSFLGALEPELAEQLVEAGLALNDWDGMARQIEVDLAVDLADTLPALRVPTLSIGFSHDHMVPPAHARDLAARVPGARYAEVDSGHLAPLECPDLLARHILDFTQEAAAPRG